MDVPAQGFRTSWLQAVNSPESKGTAAQELAGEIPDDVVSQVTRSSAFQNHSLGLLGAWE